MKPKLLSLSMAIPLAVLFGLSLPRPAEATQDPANGAGKAPAPPAIGVVDLDRIAQAHPAFTKKREALKAEHQELSGKLDALERDAKALEDRLAEFNKDSLAYLEAEQELRGKIGSLENMRKMYEAYIDLQLAKLQHDTMNEIHALIDEFAKRKKLDIVLRHRALPAMNGRPGDVRDRMQVYAFRDLVWHAPTVDVTDDVIQFLKTKEQK